MNESPLIIKSKEFALNVIKVCKELRNVKCESALINQFLRSGTSIGANVSEAERGQSKSDFYAKMTIALKEANETNYWLRLLKANDYITEQEYESLNKDLDEVISLLVAITKTTKKDLSKKSK